jgi:hypothetical protein
MPAAGSGRGPDTVIERMTGVARTAATPLGAAESTAAKTVATTIERQRACTGHFYTGDG